MLPGDIVVEEVIGNKVNDDEQDGEYGQDIDSESRPGHSPPAILFFGGFCRCGLVISYQGNERSDKRKNSKKMPYFSGQQVFAYILHGLVLILSEAFFSHIRVVFVFGRAFA